jgi:hypothetical protein
MSVLINLNTTAAAIGGGADTAAGTGQDWKFTIGGTWAVGDKVTIVLTDSLTGIQTQVGAGNITGLSPNFCFTYNNKVYMLAGATAYFSDLGSATSFNDPNGAGNSFITMSNFYATPETLTGMAPYQGKLLFTSRRNTQIWQVDPDPANYALTQVLPNVGTIAPETLQPIGDQDVYMLAENGFRSIRVRDASNNAIIADVGTPIDGIVQPLLASLTDAQKAAACGIVDPSSNRYWCYVPKPDGTAGSIYVYSYFPSSQIAAWSTYSPSYETTVAPNDGPYGWGALTLGATYLWTPGSDVKSFVCGTTSFTKGQGGKFVCDNQIATVLTVQTSGPNNGTLTLITPFVPVKFGVYNGQVWVRDSNGKIYQYGGTNNNTYSACGVVAKIPYLNVEAPATRKHFRGIDAAFQGSWSIGLSTDFTTDTYKTIYQNTVSSFQRGSVRTNRYGTHYSLSFQENSAGYALFSSAAMHFEAGDEK